jgi:hypothetical protein
VILYDLLYVHVLVSRSIRRQQHTHAYIARLVKLQTQLHRGMKYPTWSGSKNQYAAVEHSVVSISVSAQCTAPYSPVGGVLAVSGVHTLFQHIFETHYEDCFRDCG